MLGYLRKPIIIVMESFLNDNWALYFHDPDEDNWSDDSYKLICTITTVEDFVHLHRLLRNDWMKGMFFIMREHIRPQWEDKHNRDGGCFSFKIMKDEVPNYWFECVSKVLGETMFMEPYRNKWDKICGISISPKRSFCILRLWMAYQDYNDPAEYDFNPPNYTKIMYRPYAYNKDFNNTSLLQSAAAATAPGASGTPAQELSCGAKQSLISPSEAT
jgi:hypothetical protein